MSLTIIPKGVHDTMLLNYDNIVSIVTMEDVPVTDNETGEEMQGYAIVAEMLENEDVTILGVYDTGIAMEQAMSRLISWLNGSSEVDNGKVFRMPD